MTARVVARLRRRRKRRVGERADRDDDQVRLRRFRVEDLRAAVGAEVEDVLLSVRLVRDARVVAEATDDLDLIRLEPRLHPEGASRPALADKAVADGDRKRLARDFQAKLATVTGGVAGRHRRGNLASARAPRRLLGLPQALEVAPTLVGESVQAHDV